MSDLVGNPEDQFSHNEAHKRGHEYTRSPEVRKMLRQGLEEDKHTDYQIVTELN